MVCRHMWACRLADQQPHPSQAALMTMTQILLECPPQMVRPRIAFMLKDLQAAFACANVAAMLQNCNELQVRNASLHNISQSCS